MKLPQFRWLYFIIVSFMFLVQIGLGADIIVLLFMFISCLLGMFPLTPKRLEISDIAFFVFMLYNATFTIIIKTILFQPLDSNLSSPLQSTAIILVGLISSTIGYLLHRKLIHVRDCFNLSHSFNNFLMINKLALPLSIAGLGLTILQSIFGSQKVDARIEGGIGLFGSISFILSLSVVLIVSLMSFNKTKSKSEKLLLFVVSSTLLISVLLNAKAPLLQCGLAIFITYLSIENVKFQPRVIFLGILVSAISAFYLIPLIQITRPMAGDIAVIDRISYGWQTLKDTDFNPIKIADLQSSLVQRGSEFSQNGSYVFPSTLNVDRFMIVLPMDQIVRTSLPAMGVQPVIDEIIEIIPGPFVTKTQIVAADQISWYYGFRTNGYVSRPVVGLLPSCYAIFGIIGVIFMPCIIIFITLSIISITSGHFKNRVWGAFIASIAISIAEKDFSGMITWNIRGLATIIIVGLLIKLLYNMTNPSNMLLSKH